MFKVSGMDFNDSAAVLDSFIRLSLIFTIYTSFGNLSVVPIPTPKSVVPIPIEFEDEFALLL